MLAAHYGAAATWCSGGTIIIKIHLVNIEITIYIDNLCEFETIMVLLHLEKSDLQLT